LAVRFVVTVGEVKTGYVHAGVNHFNEHICFPAGWSKSADDLGSAFRDVDGFEDV